MPLKADIRRGDVVITVEGENNRLLIEGLVFWSSLPEVCPLCQQSTHFVHRRPKNKQGQAVDYFEMACEGNPQHKAQLHQHNTPGKELYYKGHGSWHVNEYSDREAGEAYGEDDDPNPSGAASGASAKEGLPCETCGVVLTPGQTTLSQHKFSQVLCVQHQPKDAGTAPAGPVAAASAPPTGQHPIDRHNQAQRQVEREIAQESPAPPPPPKPKGPPSPTPGRPASESERTACRPWVNSAIEWEVLNETEAAGFLGELDAPATTPLRLKEIHRECSARIEAQRALAEE